MRLPDTVPDPLVTAARREVNRCKAALAAGSPPDFWHWRLGNYLERLESAAAIVREQLAAIPTHPRPAPLEEP